MLAERALGAPLVWRDVFASLVQDVSFELLSPVVLSPELYSGWVSTLIVSLRTCDL